MGEYKSTLLIVDDELTICSTLEALLHKEKYNLIFAHNGLDALKKASKYIPDLILLDIMMPGMDGFEVCQRLRADKFLSQVPIIMLTALDDDKSRLKGLKVGADDFILKPYNKTELLVRVRTITRLNRYRQLLMEKEKATKAIKDSEILYSTLTELMADGVILIQNKKILFANKAFLTQFDYLESADLTGLNLSEFFNCNICPRFKKNFINISSDTIENEDIIPLIKGKCITQKKRVMWISANNRVIDWKGNPALLMTVRDITQDVFKEEMLIEQSEKIQKQYQNLKLSINERYKFGNIIGKSSAMQNVYESIIKAAETEANIIILGETGTGKELVAKSIHELSCRAKNTFMTINCGAIPENLVESEFFGYKKGIFTGAYADKKGYLASADGGTIFLDEIGELNQNIQVKLLRVIENGEYTRLGDTVSVKSNIRIISATNRDFSAMMQKGLIREDFYYRIKVITIDIPPLRKREEDIPLLVEHFLKMYSKNKKSRLTISGKMMDTLKMYNWPGNIRELQNVILKYLLNGIFDFKYFNEKINTIKIDNSLKDLQSIMCKFEKDVLTDVLNENKWHRGKTAKQLAIGQRTLYTKMKKFNLL